MHDWAVVLLWLFGCSAIVTIVSLIIWYFTVRKVAKTIVDFDAQQATSKPRRL